MLTLTHISLATTEQMFEYKKAGYQLDPFPGYTSDQWGIKAHNRPWIEAAGNFSAGEKTIEVGGAYSLLPKYLGDKYEMECWVGDDFGASQEEAIWSRWGNPNLLIEKYPSVRYVLQPFGIFSKEYPSNYFDCVFSVSTLEHIPHEHRLNVFKDMNRCVRRGGKQLHTIDISTNWKKVLVSTAVDCVPLLRELHWKASSEIRSWINIIKKSGIKVSANIPSPYRLLDRRLLVESPDVVYRFYEPVEEPKPYYPSASLLVVIEDL